MKKYQMILDAEDYQIIKSKSIDFVHKIEIKKSDYFSISYSDGYFTVYLPARVPVPAEVKADRVWRRLTLDMELDFDSPGILHDMLTPISALGVSVLAASGYSKDYLFVEEKNLRLLLQLNSEKFEIKTENESHDFEEGGLKLSNLRSILARDEEKIFCLKQYNDFSSESSVLSHSI